MASGPGLRSGRIRLQDALRIAVEHHGAGRLEPAEDIYREVLDLEPDNPTALHLLGVIAHQVGDSESAVSLIEQAVRAAPGYANAHADLGLVFNALNRVDDAIASYRRALAISADNPGAHNNLGNALLAKGRLDEAAECYRCALSLRPDYAKAHSSLGLVLNRLGGTGEALEHCCRAVALEPENADLHCNLGLVQQAGGDLEAAVASYETCLGLNPHDAEAHNNLGNTLQDLNRFEDAVSHYRESLALVPDYVEAHNNLGNALHELERFDEAILAFETAASCDAANPNTHNNLGLVYQDLGRFAEAVACFEWALAIDGDYANARSNLALGLNALGRLDEALVEFDRYLEATRGSAADAADSDRFGQISKAKVDHDIAQFQYLANRGADGFAALAEDYKALRREIHWPAYNTDLVPLTPQQCLRLAGSYNRPIHRVDAPRVAGSSLNDGLDVAAITGDYFGNAPGMTHFDNALSAEALAGLRRYLLESTIWFDLKYRGGYLGAFLNDGLACPLVLQIAEDFRATFPEIFGDHKLLQCWAYKYDSSLDGIEVHADAAAVNVNFWVTPDDANQDPESGGLIVYKEEAPLDWRFKTYNTDQARIRQFLAAADSGKMVVPHCQNRVVLFNSDLFHETDRFSFEPEYESRRINVTMLYGRRQD